MVDHISNEVLGTQVTESPEYVKVSLAAAMTLGLEPGTFYRQARLYCLNLLLTYHEGCIGQCAYCGLSQNRSAQQEQKEPSFIRVDWPIVSMKDVVAGLETQPCQHLERVCVAMVTNRRAADDTLQIVDRLHGKIETISGLITPSLINGSWLKKLKAAGTDKVGVAIDTATPKLFRELRGSGVRGPHKWDKYWRTVSDCVNVFGSFNVGIHLVVGLGETEREMIELVQRAYDLGALSHMFSFFPEPRSLIQNHPQPPIGSYRRIQLARFIINKGLLRSDSFKYDSENKIIDFGIDQDRLNTIINQGTAFRTSGCHGLNMDDACNRPFSNSTPYQASHGELRNYPFHPESDDIAIIKRQLQDYSNIPVQIWVDTDEDL